MTADILAYDRFAATLHWLTAAMVIALIALALGGDPLEEALGFRTILLHKSLGMTVFFLTLLRLVWRLGHKAPPLPATTPAWQKGAAHAMHAVIYLALLGLPLLGYIFGSAGPYPMEWFGISVPKIAVSKAVGEVAHEAHEIGGITFAILLGVHVGAALWHQFVQRDRLIARMRLA